ncbi:MAG: MFS transporter, partial [Gammaproteobacteria bacterium]|nr:MFS transporter [Gammaproteobacteria bacterium]
NDNLYKNALVLLITFEITSRSLDVKQLVNVAALLFIAPFFLFSPIAGQLADKLEKARLVRYVKLAEVAIMSLGALGFLLGSLPLLMCMLFLMGAQSTIFGPIKYGILPQHLRTGELVGGNALIELGTFLSILLGTICGGALITLGDLGIPLVAGAVVLCAMLGYIASRSIPIAAAPSPQLELNWNLWTETGRLLGYARASRPVFLSLLGIAWFWFFGLLVLTQIPPYTREVLGGDGGVATLLLTCFSLGVGAGSMLCERLSRRVIELGLVPIGALGMTLCGIALAFLHPDPDPALLAATAQSAAAASALLKGPGAFLADPGHWLLLLDLIALSAFAGVYIVPLYAYVQWKSPDSHRSRIIAGLNVLSALFMLAAAALALIVLSLGLSIPQLFLTVAVLNAVVTLYIFVQVPEFFLRLGMWVLVHSIYKVDRANLESIPTSGPAVIVSNHVSYVDALVISAVSPRPIRFVMYHKIYDQPLLKPFFRAARAIPIAPASEDPARLQQAFDEIEASLKAGALVGIFPEGALTRDGSIGPFKSGIERIVERTPVPVVPVAIRGLWGSYFSRVQGGRAMRGLPRRMAWRIGIVSSPALPPEAVDATRLEDIVKTLHASTD